MRRTPRLFLPPIGLDRDASTPLHRQISTQIAGAIRRGADGTRLPSSRVLARLLGVSRNTVLTAYDELAADGLISGRRGAAMMVMRRLAGPPDVLRLLFDAQYPSRTLTITDPDGAELYLNFSR